MKLATLRAGGRDGTLVVVRRDGQVCLPATGVAATLQQALDALNGASAAQGQPQFQPGQNPTTRALILHASSAMDRQISAILRLLVERDESLRAGPGRFPFRPPLGFLLRRLGQFLFAALLPDAARARVLSLVRKGRQ